jgi:hypothetical protein
LCLIERLEAIKVSRGGPITRSTVQSPNSVGVM